MTDTTIQQAPPESARDQLAGPRPPRQWWGTLTQLDLALDRWLGRHSLPLLQISMGAMIFGFGILKYFPDMSPAQNLVLTVTHVLTFGLVPDGVALVLLATVECGIGLSLITGRGLRVSIYLTALWVLGILSPLVLLPGRLFSGPDHAPTLEGQYVLKDIVVLAAVLVIATAVRRKAAGRERATAVGEAVDSTHSTQRDDPSR